MIGSRQFSIDGSEFVRGMTTSINTDDGGFSPEGNYSVNLTYSPGVLYASASPTDKTGTLSGLIIATTGDAARVTGATYSKAFVTSTGNVFTSDASNVLTSRQASMAGTYQVGTTDMVEYRSAVYVSTTTDVVKLTSVTAPLDTKSETWGSTGLGGVLLTGARHPLLAYENNLFIGDKNKLHRYDGSVFSASFLTLPTGQEIVALGIDPSSGRMLISVTEGNNYSNTAAQVAKVLVYDGFSNKPLRAVIVDEMVTAFYPLGGAVYVAYGQNFGYWNGSGITWLRRFKDVTNAAADLAYKHHFASIANTLYVVDGSQVLAYGEVLPGRSKVFYYAANNPTNNETLNFICNLGSNYLGMGVQTSGGTVGNFWVTDMAAVTEGGSGLCWGTRKYRFKKKVQIRQVTIQFEKSIASSATGGSIEAVDHTGSRFMSALTNNETAAVYELSCLPVETIPPSKYIKLRYLSGSSVNKGVEQITISYDEME